MTRRIPDVTRDEINAFFPFNGRCVPQLGAMAFHVPTLRFIQGEGYAFFLRRYWAEGLGRWTVRWQCRDFASAFRLAMVECWALTNTVSPDDGLAIGEIWFNPDPAKPLEGHAICPVFTENGLQFLEPQTGQLCPLAPAQFESRYSLRF